MTITELKEKRKSLIRARKKARKDNLKAIEADISKQLFILKLQEKAIDPKPKKQPKIKVKKDKKRLSIKSLLEKMKTERLFIYEEKRLEDKLIYDADFWFWKYIRKRDERKDCVTSDVETCEHKIENCCHRISRWRYSHRRDEDNCAGGCVSCNKYHAQDHGASFERKAIRESGIDRVDYQNVVKNKRKPSIEELLHIIEKYKQKYRELC